MDHDYSKLIAAVHRRHMGPIDSFTVAYMTRGGTYVLASAGHWNDSGEMHDLVAILPMAMDGESRVVILRPTVHPDLIAALREALDV